MGGREQGGFPSLSSAELKFFDSRRAESECMRSQMMRAVEHKWWLPCGALWETAKGVVDEKKSFWRAFRSRRRSAVQEAGERYTQDVS